MYEFQRLTTTSDPLFDRCWAIYCDSFPHFERRDLDAQRISMQSDDYYFEAILNHSQEVVGLVCYWTFWEGLIFVEHIAISSDCRGGGVGSEVMKRVNVMGDLTLLEIEPVEDEITRRRCSFYERCGFVVNDFNHQQPPFRDGEAWIPLVVLTYPRLASAEEFERFRAAQISIV